MPAQVSIWDLLGEAPVEMRKPLPAWIPPVVPAAPEHEPEPSPAPSGLKLTFDMGPFNRGHMRDLCEPSPNGVMISSPPFILFDDDEFLGQVVYGTEARALLFYRPDGAYGTPSSKLYVLLRFWDDEDGIPHYCSVKGDDDEAVYRAIDETVADYRRGIHLNLRGAP